MQMSLVSCHRVIGRDVRFALLLHVSKPVEEHFIVWPVELGGGTEQPKYMNVWASFSVWKSLRNVSSIGSLSLTSCALPASP
jgi:hypothetical protein